MGIEVLLIPDPGNLERKLAVAVKLDLVKPLKLEPRSKVVTVAFLDNFRLSL
jgi:hypothetical protein